MAEDSWLGEVIGAAFGGGGGPTPLGALLAIGGALLGHAIEGIITQPHADVTAAVDLLAMAAANSTNGEVEYYFSTTIYLQKGPGGEIYHTWTGSITLYVFIPGTDGECGHWESLVILSQEGLEEIYRAFNENGIELDIRKQYIDDPRDADIMY